MAAQAGLVGTGNNQAVQQQNLKSTVEAQIVLLQNNLEQLQVERDQLKRQLSKKENQMNDEILVRIHKKMQENEMQIQNTHVMLITHMQMAAAPQLMHGDMDGYEGNRGWDDVAANNTVLDASESSESSTWKQASGVEGSSEIAGSKTSGAGFESDALSAGTFNNGQPSLR